MFFPVSTVCSCTQSTNMSWVSGSVLRAGDRGMKIWEVPDFKDQTAWVCLACSYYHKVDPTITCLKFGQPWAMRPMLYDSSTPVPFQCELATSRAVPGACSLTPSPTWLLVLDLPGLRTLLLSLQKWSFGALSLTDAMEYSFLVPPPILEDHPHFPFSFLTLRPLWVNTFPIPSWNQQILPSEHLLCAGHSVKCSSRWPLTHHSRPDQMVKNRVRGDVLGGAEPREDEKGGRNIPGLESKGSRAGVCKEFDGVERGRAAHGDLRQWGWRIQAPAVQCWRVMKRLLEHIRQGSDLFGPGLQEDFLDP